MAKKSSNSSKKGSELRLFPAKSARANDVRHASPKLVGGALAIALLLALAVGPAHAYPTPPSPTPGPSVAPTPIPPGNVVPFDSNVILVLDAPISSKSSRPGDVVAMHLKQPLSVGGRVVAPAGTPATLRVVAVSPADIGDVYGFVDVFFEPLILPDGRRVPLRAPVARLQPHDTAGHESTVALEDTVADQVIPYHVLYHIFRKGKNFILAAGSELPALLEATLTQQPNGTVAIETPKPLSQNTQIPSASFPVEPAATPFEPAHSSGRKTPSPTTTPSPTPTPSP